jgi:hypothetical protein
LRETTVAAITKTLGETLKVEGNRHCWQEQRFLLCVDVLRGPDLAGGEALLDIVVECDACGERIPESQTDRGVALGDARSQVVKKYGERFDDLQAHGIDGIEYEWPDGLVLRFEFGEDRRVRRITLMGE